MIGQARIDGAYPEALRDQIGMVWHSVYPVEPTHYLEGSMRLTYWRTKPDSLTFTLFEENLQLKPRTTPHDAPIVIGQLSSAVDNCEYEIRDSDRKVHQGRTKEVRAPIHGKLGLGGYLSFRNSQSNSCSFSLTPDPRFMMYKGGCQVILDGPERRNPEAVAKASLVRILGVGTPQKSIPDAARMADRAFGIDTGQPLYNIDVTEGRVLSGRFMLQMDSRNEASSGKPGDAPGRGVLARIPRVDMPAALPVSVAGLNEHWSTVLLDRVSGRWRPVGVLDGVAYVRLDPSAADQLFFIGHPVTCDRNELHLQLTQVNSGRWLLEIHNPSREPLHAHISLNRGFTPLSSAQIRDPGVIPACDSRFIELHPVVSVETETGTGDGSRDAVGPQMGRRSLQAGKRDAACKDRV